MTVLVTGGGGLIGARIVKGLLARGESAVSFDVLADQPRLDQERDNPRLRRVAGDIRDYDRVLSVMRDHKVERVIHMAAVLVPLTEEEPAIGFAVNITGATNVFEAARHSGVKRVCYATSISTYGDQSRYGDAAVDEQSERHPYSLYGYAKLINEETAKAYTRNFGLDTRGIRIAMVFGHGRVTGRSSAISRIISAAAVGEPAVSNVDAQQQAPVIYVDDVAECMVRLCFAEKSEAAGLCRAQHAGHRAGRGRHPAPPYPGCGYPFRRGRGILSHDQEGGRNPARACHRLPRPVLRAPRAGPDQRGAGRAADAADRINQETAIKPETHEGAIHG